MTGIPSFSQKFFEGSNFSEGRSILTHYIIKSLGEEGPIASQDIRWSGDSL